MLSAPKAMAAMSLLGLLCFSFSPRDARAGWQALGSRWAVARSSRGTAVEIDDLSYPGLQGRIELGRVPPFRRAGHGPRGEDQKDAREWWRSVPWKTKADREPARFSLDDIDFSRATSDPRLFDELIGLASRKTPGFLKNFSFDREADGSYRVFWRGSGGTELPPALRVVSLMRLRSNLWRALGHQVMENMLKLATGLINVPVVAALTGGTLDRFFHWSDLLVSTRREALAELLADPPKDFGLSAAERMRAGAGILYGETRLLASPAWLWHRPGTRWLRRLSAERRAAEASRAWLARQGIGATPLGAGFDWDSRRGNLYLSAVGVPRGGTSAGPAMGLSSERPDAILARRLAAETQVTAAVYASFWVPVLGGLAASAIKILVEYPEDRRRGWEARLGARLEERERRLGENWEAELERLARQQANPLEASRARMIALVARHKAALGLQPPHPGALVSR